MNVNDLHPHAIISIVRAKSDIHVEYDPHYLKGLRFNDPVDNMACLIIAPVEFTHNNHEGTLGSIHVSGDYAQIVFQDPDEKVVYSYGDPINLRR